MSPADYFGKMRGAGGSGPPRVNPAELAWSWVGACVGIGATALIAVIGSRAVHELEFLFVLVPCALRPLVLVLVAPVVNNVPASRRYPEFGF